MSDMLLCGTGKGFLVWYDFFFFQDNKGNVAVFFFSTLQAGKPLLFFLKHPNWVTQGRAVDRRQLLLQLCVQYSVCFARNYACVCAHASVRKESVGRKKKKENTRSVTVIMQKGLVLQNNTIRDLSVRMLEETPRCCQPLCFLRNKEVACRNIHSIWCKI